MLKQQLRNLLIEKAPERDIEQWFDPLNLTQNEEGKICVCFPHQLFFEWYCVKFKNLFEELFKSCCDKPGPVYLLPGHTSGPWALKKPVCEPWKKSGLAPAVAEPVQNENLRPAARSGSEADAASEGPSAASGLSSWGKVWINECSNDYSFENFIFNRKNEYPWAAAREFSRLEAASPFVLYAGTGCGKTHLLSAIYKEIKTIVPENSIFFGKLSELKTIIENNSKTANSYFTPFLETRVFIIDNFQECASRTDLQKKLVRLIELCSEQNVHLAVSLDTPPDAWGFMERRLRSMLESGLIIEIKKPDIEVKTRYILEQSSLLGLELKKDDALNLARMYNEFRQILGALLKIYSFKSYSVAGNEMDIESILKNLRSEPLVLITPDHILNIVSEYFDLEVEEVRGKKRAKELSFARHLSMFLMRDLLALPLNRIGELMERDHSSVLYSVNKIRNLSKTNKDVHITVTNLKQLCATRAKTPRQVRKSS